MYTGFRQKSSRHPAPDRYFRDSAQKLRLWHSASTQDDPSRLRQLSEAMHRFVVDPRSSGTVAHLPCFS